MLGTLIISAASSTHAMSSSPPYSLARSLRWLRAHARRAPLPILTPYRPSGGRARGEKTCLWLEVTLALYALSLRVGDGLRVGAVTRDTFTFT